MLQTKTRVHPYLAESVHLEEEEAEVMKLLLP